MTAVITDIHYRMSLALIRDLAQGGVSLVCCEREGVEAPLGFSSRYAGRKVTLPAQGWEDALWEVCADLARREGEKPALLPVGAATLAALARQAPRFGQVCGLCIPTPEQLERFNSKEETARLARELGVPVPESLSPGPGEGPEEVAARAAYPCVVKPLCGERLGLSAAQRYVIARDPAALAAGIRRFQALDGGRFPVVQSYLPGGGLGCSVAAEEGEVRAALCHRRVREYPVTGGPSACCERVDRPELEEYAARLVRAAGYTGLAMFEFKEDGAGRPRLLEINPRIWGTFPLTRASGSGIPLLWCVLSWNRGNPDRAVPLPEPAPFRPCRMRFAASDLMSAAGYWRRGERRRALGAVADLLNPAVRDGLWEWSDPKPGLAYYRSLLRKGERT